MGYKGESREVISDGLPQEINTEFKGLVLAGGKGFDKVEVLSSRSGRTKRKRFKSAPVAAKAKVDNKPFPKKPKGS